MIPHLQNCPHQGDGWCLKCVKDLVEENEYLKYFVLNSDFGPAHGDVVSIINKGFEVDTGRKIPIKWREE